MPYETLLEQSIHREGSLLERLTQLVMQADCTSTNKLLTPSWQLLARSGAIGSDLIGEIRETSLTALRRGRYTSSRRTSARPHNPRSCSRRVRVT